jgi:hypothetical protein
VLHLFSRSEVIASGPLLLILPECEAAHQAGEGAVGNRDGMFFHENFPNPHRIALAIGKDRGDERNEVIGRWILRSAGAIPLSTRLTVFLDIFRAVLIWRIPIPFCARVRTASVVSCVIICAAPYFMVQIPDESAHLTQSCKDDAPLIALEDDFKGPGKPFKNPGRAPEIAYPFAFRAFSYFPGFLGLPLCMESPHKKGGSSDHALAHPVAGFFIMIEEHRKISRRYLLSFNPAVYD